MAQDLDAVPKCDMPPRTQSRQVTFQADICSAMRRLGSTKAARLELSWVKSIKDVLSRKALASPDVAVRVVSESVKMTSESP